jgi:hypothetical protein
MAKGSITRKTRDPLAGMHRRADVPVRQHGLDLAIYDPAAEKVHILNPVAAALWNQLTPDRTFQQVQEMLALAFKDADGGQISRDLKAAIRKLHGLGLLVSGAQRPKKPSGKKAKVVVPGLTINTLDGGYRKPGVKTYTLPQLNRLVKKAVALKIFCDLMPAPDARGRPVG